MDKNLKDIFKEDLTRNKTMIHKINIEDEFLHIDYTKTHLLQSNLTTYKDQLEKMNIKAKIDEMFNGSKINFTEQRKVLHVALRDKDVLKKLKGEDVDLKDEKKESYDELIKMREFSKVISEKKLLGATGKIIDTIVNIGIGGSDLGPRMVCEALHFYKQKDLSTHFISNVDATETILVFEKIDPEKTLFIVVSKTFTTQETIENAKLARSIFIKKTKLDEAKISKHHFVAVSSNQEEAKKFGIETVFGMGDYVGGRYSLWSTVGLSICLYIGFENFLKLLSGGSVMDEHFRSADIAQNIPINHAIVELFYNNQLGFNNKCIVPYDTYLAKLSSYLQQAEMESNGKTQTKNGKSDNKTGMIIWGEVGTNAQHSFFQLLHQGNRDILTEFLVGLEPLQTCCPHVKNHHKILYANCIAQSEALMIGKESEDPHKFFSGNRPSITIIYSKLTPNVLGALIALYEHKIFIQGIYWGINSFDQFGVELGKKLAKNILEELNEDLVANLCHDPSTNENIHIYKSKK